MKLVLIELKSGWLLKLRNINNFCIGRWQAALEHHKELEDSKNMKSKISKRKIVHLRT